MTHNSITGVGEIPAEIAEAAHTSQPVVQRHLTNSSKILLDLLNMGCRRADDEDSNEAIDRGVLRSLLAALNFRDPSTVQHSRRVAQLCVGMAERLGWDERQLRALEVGALLHDIGKIGVPDNILFKPSQLSADEAELMALHHDTCVDVLQAAGVHPEVLEIVVQSHVHYNGANQGYSRIGSDVHQGARVLAVADAYDSLKTEQVYRAGKTHDEIMHILTESAGTQFDGNVVCSLQRWSSEPNSPLQGKQPKDDSIHLPPAAGTPEGMQANLLCNIFSYLYVLESLYDGFYIVDSDLRVVVWNQGVSRLSGQPSRSMIGRTWSSRLVKYAEVEDQPLTDRDCPLNRVLETQSSMTCPMKFQHTGGRWIDVEVQTIPLINDDGEVAGVAEILRDTSRTSRRPQEYRELKLAASRDPLTSLANRGELETQLTLLVNEFANTENAETFSVIFLDIDYFKSINDSYGHAVGDEVLVALSRLLQHETYSGELVARYGGEEFVVLCPGTDLDQARRRAERLRTVISKTNIDGLKDVGITSSFGVAEMEPGDSTSSLLSRADKALYRSKEGGRNRTTSLTSKELLEGTSSTEEQQQSENPYVFTNTVYVCSAVDMIVYKLGGFVTEEGAVLKKAGESEVHMQLGTKGFLGSWGSQPNKQPVDIKVSFENSSRARPRHEASKRIPVVMNITPIGRPRNVDAFVLRAKLVANILRSYLVAD